MVKDDAEREMLFELDRSIIEISQSAPGEPGGGAAAHRALPQPRAQMRQCGMNAPASAATPGASRR